MSDADLDKRISELQKQHERYTQLYFAAPLGSSGERKYLKLANQADNELVPLYLERDALWGADDDPILRQQIADGWPS